MDRVSALAVDDPQVVDRLIARWKSVPFDERAQLVNRLSNAVTAVAEAGIQFDGPARSSIERRHELARRRYGQRLADAAYGSVGSV